MMKAAIISLGGATSLLVAEKCRKYFEEVKVIPIKAVDVNLDNNGLKVSYGGEPLEDFDCVYIRGSHKYEMTKVAITTALEGKCYLPLQHSSFTTCHNKLLTLLSLTRNKIPIPKTYVAATTEAAKKVLEKIEYPIIIKIPRGTQGKGVMFADSLKSAKTVLDALEVFKEPYMIQEYIETGSKDIRALVLGDKVLAAMQRQATKEEIRANIHMGGIGTAYKLDENTEQIALKAAKSVKAEICGVDILKNKTKTAVIEVNTSPGIRGITEATKMDIADEIAKFLFAQTKAFKEKKTSTGYSQIISNIGKKDKSKMIANLNVKNGMIKLPPLATTISNFKAGEEVVINIEKGKIEIKKSKEGGME